MNPRDINVDDLGFPIPQGFEDADPASSASSSTAPKQTKQPRRGKSPRARKVWGVLVVLAVIFLLTFPKLKESVPPKLAEWFASRATERYYSDDLSGALADLDRAVFLASDMDSLYVQRGFYRLSDVDTEGYLDACLADFNRALELNQDMGRAYEGRSLVYQRMLRHRAAVDDSTKFCVLCIHGDKARALNHRAYARALGEIDLPQGLDDVQEAIKYAGADVAAYLDTRGYLYHLNGEHASALDDLNKALRLTHGDQLRAEQRLRMQRVEGGGPARFVARHYDEQLAVLYHHRALIHQALGSDAKSARDRARANELGYDPSRGVW